MLPIGSIVYLKDGTRKIMILNRGAFIDNDGEKVIFDYSGCIYPVGLDAEQILYKVLFKGYSDNEEERYQELYSQWLLENENNFQRGKVD